MKKRELKPEGAVAAIGLGAAVAVRRNRSRRRRRSRQRARSLADRQAQEEEMQPSPNNRISQRTNEVRLGGRIPDIYGTVRSVPDQILRPYIVGGFEIGLYCVGVGQYDLADFRDGESSITDNPNASVEIYGPFQSPNNAEPINRLGPPINNPLGRTRVILNMDDTSQLQRTTFEQDLLFAFTIQGSGPPVTVRLTLTNLENGQRTNIENDYTEGDYDLNIVNPYAGSETSVRVTRTSPPAFEVVVITREEWQRTVPFFAYPEPPLPEPTRQGDEIEQSIEGIVITEFLPFEQEHFGDVTTIYTRTPAIRAEGQESTTRELNVLATRRIPLLNNDGSLGPIAGTNDAGSIIASICLDPNIGNLSHQEIDFVQIRSTIDFVNDYFGSNLASRFNYTFDDPNLSFEETISIVAEAVFCSAIRDTNVVRLFFEKPIDLPTLLISDDNKLPDTESRQILFGTEDDFDGIEFEYSNVTTERISFRVPEAANNYRTTSIIGVTSRFAAYFHAHREYNRLLFENTRVSVNCTQEVSILRPTDKVLVSDETLPGTIIGEVVSSDGNNLTLSFDVENVLDLDKSYLIFIQDVNAVVHSKPILGIVDKNTILVDSLEDVVLSVDVFNATRSLVKIIEEGDSESTEFLLESKTPGDNLQVQLELVNYDDRYYRNDRDFVDGVVTEADLSDNETSVTNTLFFRTLRSDLLYHFTDFSFAFGMPSIPFELDGFAQSSIGEPVTYTLSGPDAGRFQIDQTTGLITFTSMLFSTQPVDADGNNFYDFVVTAQAGSLVRNESISVRVDNHLNPQVQIGAPPRPPFFTNVIPNQTIQVDENTVGTFFTVQAFDANGDAVSFNLSNQFDSPLFSISETGQLSFISPPDFETPQDFNGDNVYQIVVSTSDGTQSTNVNLNIRVINLNETPPTAET